MALIESWLPPTREHWELITYIFQFFPLVTIGQWTNNWYGMGKTSVISRFNLPGKFGWLTMEAPGFLVLLYCMFTLPELEGISSLPWENKTMATLFVIHYIYRAIIFPLVAPSMSPIHVLVWLMAVVFQLFNAISIAGWLAGYGPTTRADWANRSSNYVAAARIELGLMMWAVGFLLNLFHDDDLREIRRAAARRQAAMAADDADDPPHPSTGKRKAARSGVDKVYLVPKNGAFKWLLFPHYLFEWFEWTGFWLMGGPTFTPGRSFVINEIATMLPRALQGKRWYIDTFGREKIAGRAAVIPGLL